MASTLFKCGFGSNTLSLYLSSFDLAPYIEILLAIVSEETQTQTVLLIPKKKIQHKERKMKYSLIIPKKNTTLAFSLY